MSERILTVTVSQLTGDVVDEEKMTLICLVANQTDKRNPYTAIIKIESNRRTDSTPSIYKSGEGLIYREFESVKQFQCRYGWSLVRQSRHQDDTHRLFNFNDATEQRYIFDELSEMMGADFVQDVFSNKLGMPFNPLFVNESGYQEFGVWS